MGQAPSNPTDGGATPRPRRQAVLPPDSPLPAVAPIIDAPLADISIDSEPAETLESSDVPPPLPPFAKPVTVSASSPPPPIAQLVSPAPPTTPPPTPVSASPPAPTPTPLPRLAPPVSAQRPKPVQAVAPIPVQPIKDLPIAPVATRPGSWIALGIISILLGGISVVTSGSTFVQWYNAWSGSTQAAAPQPPELPASTLPPYHGDYISQAGLPLATRSRLVKLMKLDGPEQQDREAMLDMLLAECGTLVFPDGVADVTDKGEAVISFQGNPSRVNCKILKTRAARSRSDTSPPNTSAAAASPSSCTTRRSERSTTAGTRRRTSTPSRSIRPCKA